MKPNIKVFVIIITVSYPFLVYWALQHFDAHLIFPLLLILVAIRWLVDKGDFKGGVSAFVLIVLVIIGLLWDFRIGLKFYPAMMNAGLLLLFASSLASPPTVIERLARLKEPELPLEGIKYTRKVTQVWCVFFLVNGVIAAYTAMYGSDELWVFYNGFIAYMLVGALIGGEWLVRKQVRKG